ncbi:unnamed protein product [Closterium sp. NIES-65]|nr:unnamed protein product [Closterium sp. NIES-65]
MANQATATWGFDDSVFINFARTFRVALCSKRSVAKRAVARDSLLLLSSPSRNIHSNPKGRRSRQFKKNPQPDKLMDGVEQLVDEYDIEQVASAPQLSADDVAAGELSLDCNRFLIGRSMINDRVSDHEEGITWLRSAPRLLWVARERRAEADAAERQRRREK